MIRTLGSDSCRAGAPDPAVADATCDQCRVILANAASNGGIGRSRPTSIRRINDNPRYPLALFRAFLRPTLTTVALLTLSACSHYQLGTGGTPGFHTLYVAPVANKTALPQAREITSTRLRETIARDGRVALSNSAADADAVLTVTLVDFHREITAVREGDTGLARKFNLVLGADCTLRQRDGKVIWENRHVEIVREAFTDAGQLQSEYQTVPLLAEALAGKIAHAALDVW